LKFILPSPYSPEAFGGNLANNATCEVIAVVIIEITISGCDAVYSDRT
jgi:hypothetical protein